MTIALAPHVTASETEDGLVLLDEEQGRYWQLNRTASLVLRLLLEGNGVPEVVDTLRARTPEGSERAAEDVEKLLASLRRSKLVTA
ncbi:lasso peptide biosynthesis PqqD family chaperone [Streptomyces sp. BRA346]|uniref:lasso peptide biosynthesis PqqD family chaperone n=1 Tax=Streptomyces sp. BRA346 TaxID=2878199 RepID=UPI0040633689